MKSMTLSFITLCFFSSISAFAGGSSVVGVGAPQITYQCYEFEYDPYNQNTNLPSKLDVSIGKFAPKYELKISVLDRTQKTLVTESTQRRMSGLVGGPLQYVSQNFELNIYAASAPWIESGHVYHASELKKNGQTLYPLKCERVAK